MDFRGARLVGQQLKEADIVHLLFLILRVINCITQTIVVLHSAFASSRAQEGPEPIQVIVLPSVRAKFAKVSLTLFWERLI